MRVAIHDAEAEHFGTFDKFPNYALMKISAYHKSIGDTVEWFFPLEASSYDKVYSSKVFDFTPESPYLPEGTIKGGTGYGIFKDLPEEIDNMFPDYSIYPSCDYAIGFLTRGCIRRCRWCVVPKKEGGIRPYRTWDQVVRSDTKKLVLMDNNILSIDYGINQLAELAKTDYKIDLNQGMDARLVTPAIADILCKVKWIKNIRFACDHSSQIESIRNVAALLQERGVPASKMFVYFLVTKDIEDCLRRVDALRDLGAITLYAQAEQNPTLGIFPDRWQKVFAQKYIYGGQWRKQNFEEWAKEHQGCFGSDIFSVNSIRRMK